MPVLEDAAQAAGSIASDGRRPGALGKAATFSFFPSKNLGAFGDGGMITTSDEQIAERARTLRFHGSHDKVTYEQIGYNSRLDELQAAILRVQLPHLDEMGRRAPASRAPLRAGRARRARAAAARDRGRRAGVAPVRRRRSCRRASWKARLRNAGIGHKAYYRTPVHRQVAMREWGAGVELPATDEAARTHLAIPMSPVLTREQVDEVVAAVRATRASASARAGPRPGPRARRGPARPSTTARGGHVAGDDRAGGDERLLADLHAGRQHGAAAHPARASQRRATQADPPPTRGAPSCRRSSSSRPGPRTRRPRSRCRRSGRRSSAPARGRPTETSLSTTLPRPITVPGPIRVRSRTKLWSPRIEPVADARAREHDRAGADLHVAGQLQPADLARRRGARRQPRALAQHGVVLDHAAVADHGARRARPRERRTRPLCRSARPRPSISPGARGSSPSRAHRRITFSACVPRVTPRRSTTRPPRSAIALWSTLGCAVTISVRSASLERLLQRLALEGELGQRGDVRVVVAQLGAERAQQRDDLQRRRLADVADAGLVADPEHRDPRALHGQAGVVEHALDLRDAVVGHLLVDLPRQLDELGRHVELARAPAQIEGVDRQAVPAHARARARSA